MGLQPVTPASVPSLPGAVPFGQRQLLFACIRKAGSVLLLFFLICHMMVCTVEPAAAGLVGRDVNPRRPLKRHSHVAVKHSYIAGEKDNEGTETELHRRSVTALEYAEPFRLRTDSQYEVFLVENDGVEPKLEPKRTDAVHRGAWFKLQSVPKECPNFTNNFSNNFRHKDKADKGVACPYQLLVSNNMTDNNSYRHVCINKKGRIYVAMEPDKMNECYFMEEPSVPHFKFYSYGHFKRMQKKLPFCPDVVGPLSMPLLREQPTSKKRVKQCKWYLEVNKEGGWRRANTAKATKGGSNFMKLKKETVPEPFPNGTIHNIGKPIVKDTVVEKATTKKPPRHGQSGRKRQRKNKKQRPKNTPKDYGGVDGPFGLSGVANEKRQNRRGSKRGRPGSNNPGNPLGGHSASSSKTRREDSNNWRGMLIHTGPSPVR